MLVVHNALSVLVEQGAFVLELGVRVFPREDNREKGVRSSDQQQQRFIFVDGISLFDAGF